ncbi:formin-like protein 3 [Quercus suber]
MRQLVLDCLRRKSFLFHPDEDSLKNRFIKCAELLFSLPNAPRRHLVSQSPGQIATSPAPAPSTTEAESPNYGPAPSNLAPSSSSSPNPNPPVQVPEAPAPSLNVISSPPPRPKHLPPHHSVVPQNSPKKDSYQMKTIVVAAAIAVGVLALLALLLICCLKGGSNKIGPKEGQRDERPLLNLRMSDFSAGSSQKSVSIGNSSNKDFSINSGVNPSFLTNMSMKHGTNDSTLAGALSSEGTGSVPFLQLKPPPGRSVTMSLAPPSPPSPPPPLPPPPPPPPPPIAPSAPKPPPPPKVARPPPAPPKAMPGKYQPSPFGLNHRGSNDSSEGGDLDGESGAPKTKLKPFFWDKVLANPDQSMVWHEINSGSFQFNEEMIESLFGYNNMDKNKIDRKRELASLEPSIQYVQIIDAKKAQNLSILVRALNVTTEEVIDALQEGNELPVELLQTLLKMAPSTEEELKLRLYSGDISRLGPAEQFLKIFVDIPFAFKRLESLLFMSSLREEVSNIKESLATLEVACNKLRNSRLFLKLLEAVLKTGNRMNDGTYRGGAHAFKLDTLLKLSDVKGTDGKTTLLHFVVQEIIRSEGIRAVRTARESQSLSSMKTDDFTDDFTEESEEHYRRLGLLVVSGLSNELEDVKKAAFIDADLLTSTVSKLNQSLIKNKGFLNAEMKSLDEESEFTHVLANFVEFVEADISGLLEEEKKIMALVKSTADYFHGNAGKDEGLRLFAIVRDFLRMLDKACKEVRDAGMKRVRITKKEALSVSSRQSTDIRPRLFPAIMERRMDNNSSSDDENLSP